MTDYLILGGVVIALGLQLVALGHIGKLIENAEAQSAALGEALRRLPRTRSRKGELGAGDGA